MKTIDFMLIGIIIICIFVIIITLQAINNATFLNVLSNLGIIENSKNGLRTIFFTIIYSSAIIFVSLLLLAGRFFKRILIKD